MYLSLAFWTGALERAVKTGAQTAISVLGLDSLGIVDVDWQAGGSLVASAVVLSVLTSIADPKRAALPTDDGPAHLAE